MRVLVLGANGMLGRDIVAAFGHAHEVAAATREEADLTARASLELVLDAARPEVVINAAGYTRVDDAEREPETAFAVNADGVRTLAEECVRRAISLCHISTDFVFDGTKGSPYIELDPPNPINAYGYSKLAGEDAIRETLAEHWIVRTQWLFADHGNNFVRTMLRLMNERPTVSVVNDQWGAPTSTRDVADALRTIVESVPHGIYHANNAGHASWYEFAAAIAERTGRDADIVKPISAADFASPTPRPRDSTLARAALAELNLDNARPWQDALTEVLANLNPES